MSAILYLFRIWGDVFTVYKIRCVKIFVAIKYWCEDDLNKFFRLSPENTFLSQTLLFIFQNGCSLKTS